MGHPSTLAHRLALRIEARQTIGNLVPGRFGLDCKVKSRSHARVCIECPETQAQFTRTVRAMAENGGAAHAAEATKLSRRGLVLRDQVGSLRKAKVLSLDGCVGGKCAPLGTAAHRAVAVRDDAKGTVGAKPNSTAQARARNPSHLITGVHRAMMPRGGDCANLSSRRRSSAPRCWLPGY